MTRAAAPAGASAPAGGDAPLVKVEGLTHSYGPVRVLEDVSFDLRPGEVHALLGANGAGKSTLIKALAGLLSYDSGSIEVRGQHVPRHTTGHALNQLGLAFVHQDLGLVEEMTIAENIALEAGYAHKWGLIDFKGTARAGRKATSELGLDVDPNAPVASLEQDEKVMVAVARAFSLHARALVLDEVSSSLPSPEVTRLLETIKKTTSLGLGYVYVTHRLDELFGVADRVTVLRDGRVVLTSAMADLDKAKIVEAIVEPKADPHTDGAAVMARGWSESDSAAPHPPHAEVSSGPGDVLLDVTDLDVRHHGAPLSFEVRAGEVVALCGLIGCGAKEVARVLGGDLHPRLGTVELESAPLPLGNPAAIRDMGCSYVPGDRQGEGVVGQLSIRENLFITRRGGQGRRGNQVFRVPKAERALAQELADSVTLRPAGSVERPMLTLSGGNQQKVVCARALRTSPRLLVLDDPTAGVDIGSRAQVHKLIRDAAAEGSAVVFASTDYDEVALLADRALVMVGGTIAAELTGQQLTASNVARASYGEGL